MAGHSNGHSLANDWRSQHEPDLREKVIFTIVEKLKICFPGHISSINKTAITFENKIYGIARDKDDYLRKISEKILAFNRKFRTVSSANGAHTPNPAAQPLNQSQQQSSNTMFQHQMDQQLLKDKIHHRNQQQHHQQSLLRQQQLPHHTSLSPIKQSFPQSSPLSSLPSSGQPNSQFLPRHEFPTQRIHSSHQQQMDVPSQKHNHLTSPQNIREKQQTSQQDNMDSFNLHGSSLLATQGQEVDQSQNRILDQHLDATLRFQAADSLHHSQNQQKKPYQLQRALPENPSTCQDSTCKTLDTSGGDWREETYQKIKALREKHILVLITMFQRISAKLQAIDSLPQDKMMPYEPVKKLRACRAVLEQVFIFLNVSRDSVSEKHRDRFSLCEARVLKLSNSQREKQQEQPQVHLPPSQTNQTSLQSQSGHQVHVSQTAMPRMEPTDENKVMSSSGNVLVHSLEQNPQQIQRVNSEAELFQQHVSSSQRQLPKPLASPARMSQLASSPQKQNSSSPTTLNKTEAEEHSLFTIPPEPITERPIDRLIKAIQSSSPESLALSVSEMSSVISLSDRFAGSFHSTRGYGARVAEDLSERTRLHLQQGDTDPTKRFKRSFSTMPLASRVNNIEPSYALLKEINETNGRLVETVVSICNEHVCPSEVTSGLTVVTCTYVPVALSSTFKALYNSGHISKIQPLRLLVPESYPCSPIILEKTLFDTASVHKHEDLSARARSRFGLSAKKYSEAMTLKEIAKVWDECARATMLEYAQRHGGGTFSSKYGHWESVKRA